MLLRGKMRRPVRAFCIGVNHRWRQARALGRVVFLARVSVLFGALGVALLFDAQGRDSLVILTDGTTGLHSKILFVLAVMLWGGSVWFWGRIAVSLDAHVIVTLNGRVEAKAHRFFRAWVPRAASFLALFGANAAMFMSFMDGDVALSGWALFIVTAIASLGTTGLLMWRRLIVRSYHIRRGLTGPMMPAAPSGNHAAWTEIRRSHRNWAITLFCASLAALLLVSFAIDPLVSGVLGSIVLFFMAACIWLALPGFLSLRLYAHRVPVISIAIVLGLGLSFCNDNHDVRTMSRVNGDVLPEPASVRTWLDGRKPVNSVWENWQKAQAPWKNHPRQMPVVIVTTAGGGIRAAVWTTEILGRLHSEPDSLFEKRLFAISAVSGGAFGSVVYMALTQDTCRDKAAQSIVPCARLVFQRDMLAPVSATFFFKDSLQNFIPFPLAGDDRAAALERSFEEAFRDHTGQKTLARAFHALWRQKDAQGQRQEWPILLLNGTSVGAGRRVIASNVRVDREPFGYAIDLFRILGQDVPVSTAANIAGRFPFVEPAGTVKFDCQRLPPKPSLVSGERETDDDRLPASVETLRARCKDGNKPVVFDQVVDGGYFENFGATAVNYLLDYIRTLSDKQNERLPEQDRVTLFPIVIQISSDPDLQPREGPESPATPAPEPLAWIQDYWAPISGIFATRGARGEDATYSLAQTTFGPGNKQGAYFHLAMCKEATVEPPLGWVMSMKAHAVIHKEMMLRCHCNAEKLEVIFKCLRGDYRTPADCAQEAYAYSRRDQNLCPEKPVVAQRSAK